MPNPLVSIVLATYNGEKYLAEQLDSLLAQTYPHIELIAVDDLSKDGTLSILRQYEQIHPNMKVFVNETNLGYIKNFNKACSLSSGQLIAFCDQDDRWAPEKIARQVAAIGAHDLVYCNSRLCDQDLQPLGRTIEDMAVLKSYHYCLELAVFCRMYGHAIMITRRLFEAADPFLDMIPPDWWISYLATLHGGALYLPETMVDYRQHANNTFGVVGIKRKKKKDAWWIRKHADLVRSHDRMERFLQAVPLSMKKERKIMGSILASYRSFSVWNNFRRVFVYLGHHRVLLTVKRYSEFRKILFCFKMFVNVR